MVAGNETVDLLYEGLWKDLSYSLQVDEGQDASEVIFDNVPYAELASLLGTDSDRETIDDMSDSDEPEAVRSLGFAGLNLFLSEGEET
jgi:hypothetical protein